MYNYFINRCFYFGKILCNFNSRGETARIVALKIFGKQKEVQNTIIVFLSYTRILFIIKNESIDSEFERSYRPVKQQFFLFPLYFPPFE